MAIIAVTKVGKMETMLEDYVDDFRGYNNRLQSNRSSTQTHECPPELEGK